MIRTESIVSSHQCVCVFVIVSTWQDVVIHQQSRDTFSVYLCTPVHDDHHRLTAGETTD